ncbi:hypothetical protein NF699_08080 [Sphingomonadaceae bacterium OTU29LAMAA1]|nr:hypothetical protein NF699_08080 [Sphingomonadaceae bacterium OTU29LAMAA1]
MPLFSHRFTPASASPLGTSVDLTVQEVEDAGLREVLQTPGVALGNWGLLSALLHPGSSHFLFHAPLGQAREVKTAVSGLFGRFVARAYATRYLRYSHFVHITKPPMMLSGAMNGLLRRTPRFPSGDLPDWVTWGAGAGLGIVEAKGCHDQGSPAAALERARKQALRAEITVGGRPATFKRFAIATRWGYATPTRTQPMLWVHDPVAEGGESPEAAAALALGVARYHAARLLAPLGYQELADQLLGLARDPLPASRNRRQRRGREVLAEAPVFEMDDVEGAAGEALLGAVVVRGSKLAPADLSPSDRETLERLDLNPTFVGIDRQEVKRLIEGETTPPAPPTDAQRVLVGDDGAGGRVVRLGRDGGTVRLV